MAAMRSSAYGLPALFCVTIFLSAGLLFSVQPMVARMLLPRFGGAAAVWNTCLVFYQTVLLVGYVYAHLLDQRVRPRMQVAIHLGLLLVAAAALPLTVSSGATDPGAPVSSLLLALIPAVGLPFLALSGTSTLLQAWFSRSGHGAARDPYFLYAASNLGSMLALAAYPLWIAPGLGVTDQTLGWAGGYTALIGLLGVAGYLATRHPEIATAISPGSSAATTRLKPARRARWVGLAFVPSSMMMAVTLHITTDIAPLPLLWVVPLALYLLGFIVAFARLPARLLRAASLAAVPVLFVVLFYLLSHVAQPMWRAVSLHSLALFLTATVFHGLLAADRPAPEHLTEFYLWISVGGALGGVFNALIAPVAFDSLLEYPLILTVALVVLAVRGRPGRRALTIDLGLSGLIAAACWWLVVQWAPGDWDVSGLSDSLGLNLFATRATLAYGVVLLACAALAIGRRAPALALSLLVVIGLCGLDDAQSSGEVFRQRSFYGVLSVTDDADGTCRHMMHGKTPHGRQHRHPGQRQTPRGFYNRYSPIGDIFAERSGPDSGPPVAVVGLGTGTLAAYGQAGQSMTFYELDPHVIELAQTPEWFTYLSDSPAAIEVIAGDARLSLESAPDAAFELLVVDAFSSDAVPFHLLTREAIALYLRKLTPTGVLAVHTTNRYVDIDQVVARLGQDARLQVRKSQWSGRDGCSRIYTQWVMLARASTDFGGLAESTDWTPVTIEEHVPVWTDDYASLLSVLSWSGRW
ncbi:MAG: hypothetical protein ACI9WU_004761 [Myxococcota bacterium]|jgi:hypothetical protein